jgi:hypothetical protein
LLNPTIAYQEIWKETSQALTASNSAFRPFQPVSAHRKAGRPSWLSPEVWDLVTHRMEDVIYQYVPSMTPFLPASAAELLQAVNADREHSVELMDDTGPRIPKTSLREVGACRSLGWVRAPSDDSDESEGRSLRPGSR